MDKLEMRIKWIGHPLSGGITNPKLPFRVDTTNAVQVIAAMFNDGYVGGGGARSHGVMHYYNENSTLRFSVITSAADAFGGDKTSYRVREHRGDHHVVFPSVARDLMKQIGVTVGSKANYNPHVPALVHASERPDLWRRWLRQTADDEGGVRFRPKVKSRHVYWRRCVSLDLNLIEVKKERKSFSCLSDESKKIVLDKVPNLLKGEKELLKRLDVECKVRPLSVYRIKTGECRAIWELYIGGRENLERFCRTVGFNHPKKSKLLEEALQSYT